MAATLTLGVSTGSTPTVADAVTGIDLISADNSTNTLANRQANPITVGTNSYEKWIRLKIAATPTNYVQSFKVWFNSTVDTSTTLFFTGAFVTYYQASTRTTISNVDATGFTSGNKATWDLASYTSAQTGVYTKYLVLQLAVASTAGPGNWTQQTVNYSYDEA
jgi:hypothetical protein